MGWARLQQVDLKLHEQGSVFSENNASPQTEGAGGVLVYERRACSRSPMIEWTPSMGVPDSASSGHPPAEF